MPIQKKKNRIINVDGVMYNLDTARPVTPDDSAPKPIDPPEPTSAISTRKAPARGLDIARAPIRRDTPKNPVVPNDMRDQPVIKKPSPIQPSPNVNQLEPISPHEFKSNLPAEQSYQQQALQALRQHPRGVSHPTLPISPSTRRSTPGRWWTHVVWATTFKGSGGKIGRLAFLQVLFSPLTWGLLAAPIIVMWLLSWRNATLTDLSEVVRTALSPQNYWGFVSATAIVPLILALLAGASAMFGLTIYGVRVSQCDHRTVKSKALLGRILGRIDRVLLNWFYNSVLVLMLFFVVGGALIWLLGVYSGHLDWLKPVLVAVSLLVGVLGLAFVYLIKPLQRGFLATIDEKLSFIRPKSRELFWHSFGKTVLAGALALLVNIITICLVLTISWAQYTYLANTQSALAQVAIILGGISLSIVVLSVRLGWLQSFWAAHFHYALLQSPKGHMVAVLNQPTRQRRKVNALIKLAIIYIVLAGSVVVTGYYFQANIQKNLEHIDRIIPQDFSQLIPKNN